MKSYGPGVALYSAIYPRYLEVTSTTILLQPEPREVIERYRGSALVPHQHQPGFFETLGRQHLPTRESMVYPEYQAMVVQEV
jgi:hypothetical protein